jgi:hypothetical protein
MRAYTVAKFAGPVLLSSAKSAREHENFLYFQNQVDQCTESREGAEYKAHLELALERIRGSVQCAFS